MEVPDYGDHAVTPKNADLAELTDAVRALERAEDELQDATVEALVKQQARDDLALCAIPRIMEGLGFKPGAKIPLGGGVVVELSEDVKTKIPKARAEEAFAWLEAQGQGGLIKREIVVGFRREEQEAATELLGQLADYENVKEAQRVESSTLKKFVRDALARGEEVPRDLFGVFEFKEVKLKRKR